MLQLAWEVKYRSLSTLILVPRYFQIWVEDTTNNQPYKYCVIHILPKWFWIDYRIHSFIGTILAKDLIFECNFRSRYASLNKHHAYFLLVDNGTVGKYGAEIALRRKLEKFISTQSLSGSRAGFSTPIGKAILLFKIYPLEAEPVKISVHVFFQAQ